MEADMDTASRAEWPPSAMQDEREREKPSIKYAVHVHEHGGEPSDKKRDSEIKERTLSIFENTSTWQHDGVRQQSSVRDKYVEHKETKVKGKYRGFGWLQTELTITVKARFEL